MAELNRVPATMSVSEPDHGLVLITMGGEYDIGGIEPLDPELDAVLSKDASSVVVEMGKVSFMDTSGVALLLRIANQFGPLEIRNANPLVSRAIEALGLAGRLRIVRG